MRWFVSREMYELALASRDVEHETAALVRAQLLDMTIKHADSLTSRDKATAAALESKDKAYADLLAKYHALREKGYHFADPQSFPVVTSPLDELGPDTKAALKAMSVGLPSANRRAMEASALALHANKMPDAQVADAVRRGEAPRSSPRH